MSVINQVLLELEKRRASGVERAVVPDHVRAIPENGTDRRVWWLAGAALAALALVALAGALVTGSGWLRGGLPGAARAQAGQDPLMERMVTASATVVTDVAPREDTSELPASSPQFAGRLSFELSSAPVPRPADEPAPREAIPSARVLARTENADRTERGPAAQAAAAPAPEAQHAPAPPGKPAIAPAGKQRAVAVEKATETSSPNIEKQLRQPVPRDLSDAEYRKAAAHLHHGRSQEALEGFRAAINLYPAHHGARQALAALLVESRAHAEAERVLLEGVRIAPEQIGFAMTLARLQVDRGDLTGAIATLQGGQAYAQGSPDYIAFLAALLQRNGRHEDAVAQFQAALRAKPSNGVWWLGLGVSLQSVGRGGDAQEAFRRARATNNLSPELAAFADQRLRQTQ